MPLAVTSEAVMCLSFSFMRLTLSPRRPPASRSPPVQTAASWCNGLAVDAPVLIPPPRLARSAFACLDDMLFRAVVKARRGPSPWVQVTYA